MVNCNRFHYEIRTGNFKTVIMLSDRYIIINHKERGNSAGGRKYPIEHYLLWGIKSVDLSMDTYIDLVSPKELREEIRATRGILQLAL